MINLCKSFTYFSSIVTEKINVNKSNKCYFRIVRNKNIISFKIQTSRERDIWTPARVDNFDTHFRLSWDFYVNYVICHSVFDSKLCGISSR